MKSNHVLNGTELLKAELRALQETVKKFHLDGVFLELAQLQYHPNESTYPAAGRMVAAMILQIRNGAIIEGRPGHAPSGLNPEKLQTWQHAFSAGNQALTDLQKCIGVQRSAIFRAKIQEELETSLSLLPDHIEGMMQ